MVKSKNFCVDDSQYPYPKIIESRERQGIKMSVDFSVQRQGAYEIKNPHINPNRKSADPEMDFSLTHSRLVGNGYTSAQRLGMSEEEYNSTETLAEQIGISKEDYIFFLV